MSVNEEFNNAMLAHSRKKELLIRLLQKEEMKDAMFKELQIKHGGGFAPTKALEEKTDAAVNELLANNGLGKVVENSEVEQQGEDVNVLDAGRPPSAASVRAPSRAGSRPPSARSRSATRSRPQSARSSRPQSARSSRASSSADSRQRPRSAGYRRQARHYDYSPIRNALDKLYVTTADLRPRKVVRRVRPQSARSTTSQASRKTAGSSKSNGRQRPQSAREPRKLTVGDSVEARSHSRNEYRPANIVQKNDDGTFDVAFNQGKAGAKSRYDKIPSIGLKRVKEVVKHKVEQRVRGPSTGKWATVNPHVLKGFFKLFNPNSNGELPRDRFAAALREKLGLENISSKDMNALMDEYDQDGDGNITYEEFSAQVLPQDFHEGRGIIDFPHGDPQGGADEHLPKLKNQLRTYLEQQKNMREAFRKMGAAGNGEVSLYQFKACLRNANLGIGMDRAMGILFKKIDQDGSGLIDFDEFASELNKNVEATDNNFFIGGGRHKKKKHTVVQHIGVKRLQSLLQDKLEQKAKGTACGQWAMTSPHILRKFFKEFDEDDSGELDLQEFQKAIRWKLGLMNVSDTDIEALFKTFDKTGKGTISYEEFVDKTMPKEFTFGGGGIMDFPGDHPHNGQSVEEQVAQLMKEVKEKLHSAAKNMREVFRRVGGSGDGEIDKYEFKACLRQQHLGIGQEKIVDRLFDKIDKDKSGEITFDEFASALNSDENLNANTFFVGGGNAKKKRYGNVPSIGAKAVMEILKDKIEQKVRGRSTGAFATVNPNILRSMFLSFCSNDSGELTHAEFSEAMRFKLGLLNISEKDLAAVAKLFDKDGDGSIDFDEFVAKVLPPEIVNGNGGIMDWEGENGVAYSGPKLQFKELKKRVKKYLEQHKNMREVFRKMGKGGNGEVTKYEFKACLRNSGVSHGLDRAADMLYAEIDKDESGSISFDEFCTALNSGEEKEEGNFFIGGGRTVVGKARVKVPSIGIKRLKEILKDKIEQKCKGRASGAYARTSAHELKKIFHEFDTDNGGSLSHAEFKEALRTKLGLMNVSDADLDALAKEYDKDGDGDISYDEFIHNVMPPEISHGGGGLMDFPCDDPATKGSADEKFSRLKKDVRKKVTAAAANLRNAFRKMGAAGSGKIGKYEFRTALRNFNIGLGMPQIVDRLFAEIDSDNSGSITFKEFADGMKSQPDGGKQAGPIISRKLNRNQIRPIVPSNVPTEVPETKVETKVETEEQGQNIWKAQKSIAPAVKRNVFQPKLYNGMKGRRPATPRDLLTKGQQGGVDVEPVRPKSGSRNSFRRAARRPLSAGRQLNQTVAAPMQISRKPRWQGSKGIGRSAPQRLARQKFKAQRRQRGTIVDDLKRRYIEEAKRSGIIVPRNNSRSGRQSNKLDLSSILGVKKL